MPKVETKHFKQKKDVDAEEFAIHAGRAAAGKLIGKALKKTAQEKKDAKTD